jgi:hypothetical protein
MVLVHKKTSHLQNWKKCGVVVVKHGKQTSHLQNWRKCSIVVVKHGGLLALGYPSFITDVAE